MGNPDGTLDTQDKLTLAKIIADLQSQNRALQKYNTELVERVRELEKDGKRLDWLFDPDRLRWLAQLWNEEQRPRSPRDAIDSAMEGE
jgi:hypothetical protein